MLLLTINKDFKGSPRALLFAESLAHECNADAVLAEWLSLGDKTKLSVVKEIEGMQTNVLQFIECNCTCTKHKWSLYQKKGKLIAILLFLCSELI